MTLRIVVDNQKKPAAKRDIVQPTSYEKDDHTLVLLICDCGGKKIMTNKQALSYICACERKSL